MRLCDTNKILKTFLTHAKSKSWFKITSRINTFDAKEMHFDNNIVPFNQTNFGFYYPDGEIIMFSLTPAHLMDIMQIKFYMIRILIDIFNNTFVRGKQYLNPYANEWFPYKQQFTREPNEKNYQQNN